MSFYVVYIQEAHPTDLWQLPSNVKDQVLFRSPTSDGERVSTASACVRNLGIRLPALIDRIDDSTERAYTAWPDRMYLIERGGKIRYKSAPGPYGFSTGDLKTELDAVAGLSKTSRLSTDHSRQ